jgi:predicted nucleotidyltransferase
MVDLPHLRARREAILRLATSYGASNVRVFGSLARGDARSDSDIDLVVDMPPDQSLLAWSAFWQQLEAIVGSRIDLAVSSDLRPEVRRAVLAEAIPL